MKITNKFILATFIPITLLLTAFAISGILINASYKATTDYIENYVERQIIITNLYTALGYGKGIHNFKNYVIRGSEEYRKRADSELLSALKSIETYNQFQHISTVEKNALQDIEKTIQLYLSRLHVIKNLLMQNKTVNQIDNAVKVDDTAAIHALNQIHNYLIEKRFMEIAALDKSQKTIWILIAVATLISTIIAAIATKTILSQLRISISSLISISSRISKGDYSTSKNQLSHLSNDELKTLGEHMIEMSDHLENAFSTINQKNKDLEQFAYTIAHDLKAPVGKIANFSEFLIEDMQGKINQESEDIITNIRKSAIRMSNLITSLLEFSRITGQGKTFTPIDLNHVYEQAKDNLLLQIKESDIDIQKDKLPVVKGNEILLVQLFQNLMANAIKFRQPDQPAKLSINAKYNQGKWKIMFEDNGIGFDENITDTILKPFGRAQNTKDYPGTGIGLATCNRILNEHGSAFEITSTVKKGSSFSFYL